TASNVLPDASLIARIIAPGSTAFVESVIVPLSTASWANARGGRTRETPTTINHLPRPAIIVSSRSGWARGRTGVEGCRAETNVACATSQRDKSGRRDVWDLSESC